jgi:YgiT-type zinc finger domain-containing protein
MNRYADCTYCGGEVVEQTIDYDDRRQTHLIVVSNVPAGVCRQCGEPFAVVCLDLRMVQKLAMREEIADLADRLEAHQ